jgi:transposase-like protein
MDIELNNLLQDTEYFSDTQKCEDLLLKVRWNNEVKCVFCKHHKVYHLQGKNKRYKCAQCLKQFSIIKGTIFKIVPSLCKNGLS